MISSGLVLLLVCFSVSHGEEDTLARVDRVLENLLAQNTLSGSYGASFVDFDKSFDIETFLDHGKQFKEFVREYEREYETDTEVEKRFNIFRDNLKEIERFTQYEQGTATYGVTQFADQTELEFNYGLSPINIDEIKKLSLEPYQSNATSFRASPESLDYRKKGVILEKVQDQHLCGSCWAHATAANIESAYAQKTNTLIELSKQQLVDCDFGDGGCCGGWPFRAYSYVKQVGGIMTEKDYKQRIFEGPCKFDKSKFKVQIGKSYILYNFDDPLFNEYKYEQYMNDVGTLVTIMNASGLRFYKGGVLNQPSILCSRSTGSLNHALLYVGYGVESIGNEKYPYWIIKNSWGKKWGEDGYFKIAKGVNSCGLGWLATGVTAL